MPKMHGGMRSGRHDAAETARLISVRAAAEEAFGGDEGAVWTSIVQGATKATALLELLSGESLEIDLLPSEARRFLGGAGEIAARRRRWRPPDELRDGSLLVVHEKETVSGKIRASTVTVIANLDGSVSTKSLNHIYRVIGVLCRELKIDPAARGEGQRLEKLASKHGLKLGADKARAVLQAVAAAENRGKKR